MFNGQFRFSENLMYGKKLRKLLLPIVYNGRSTTIFCVTRKILADYNYCKCIKAFFGYKRFDSVTYMLYDLSLPSFDTVTLNSKYGFKMQCRSTNNALVSMFTARLILVLRPFYCVCYSCNYLSSVCPN